ncbi:hypothetical protein MAPG_00324 [Magnaporthiopsis poae ATCC 64411]|uniref:Uncharacterized protein n=1 Tax=Magnaporthiopsis poae (strain ATCC 64411 / 73-15) TaxID=644358 RepID=A0A0C4DKP6_MAGP6|nr:hypothetical protein MAPG_00324 [Magnaporthiopsis poae ATCC 64411]
MTRQELKAYMSSRPPSLTTDESNQQQSATQQKTKTKKPAPAEDSADLLANDLALQRLLSESHLLSAATGHASSSTTLLSSVAVQTRPSAASSAAFAEGRLRRRTADLRMQALGSRESVFAQTKMPLAIRRGIAQHRADREARRRREARECGVVLEAPASSSGVEEACRWWWWWCTPRRRPQSLGMPGRGRNARRRAQDQR